MKKLWIFILYLIFYLPAFGQYPEIRFEHFNYKQGLNDEGIRNIVQDNKGFLWMGETRLHKYDGYTFTTVADLPGCKVYPADTITWIQTFFQDDLGIMWIRYNSSLVLFNPENEKSVLLKNNLCRDTSDVSWGREVVIFRGSGHDIWIASKYRLHKLTYKTGITKPDIKDMLMDSKFMTVFNIDTFNIYSEKNQRDHIRVMYEDSWKNLWVGGDKGLYMMRKGERSFFRLDDDKSGNSRLPITDTHLILQEDDNSFLVGNWYGIFRISNVRNSLMAKNPDKYLLEFSRKNLFQRASTLFKDRNQNVYLASASNIFILKRDDLKNSDSLIPLYRNVSGNDEDQFAYVFKIMQDRNGALWLGQGYNGMLKFNMERSQFTSYKKAVFGNAENIFVDFMCEDHLGNLWISAGDIYKVQPDNLKTTQFKAGFTGRRLVCASEIKPGIFWCIKDQGGLCEFDSNTGKFRDPLPKTIEASNLRNTQAGSMLKDGNLEYICTASAIFVYDFSAGKLHQFTVNRNDSVFKYMPYIFSAIVKSKDGAIWTVANGTMGLCKIIYNPVNESMSFLPFKTPYLSERNLIYDDNTVLYQDSQGLFWVGNTNPKLNLHSINIKTGEIKSYNLFGRLIYAGIGSIIEDDHNNLWIGTEIGLYQFNTLTGQAKRYSGEEGLPLHVHGGCALKTKDGRMFFGGMGGFYSFHTDSLKINNSIPPIVITDFRLFNKPVRVNTIEKSVLTKNISYTGEIELQHNQNDLSFEFASLDFTQPMKNRYAYKLEGYQEEWVETDARNRVATFTNLSPGTYIFHVKGSNNDGVWNEKGTSLTVIIHKPWWGTTMAWLIYILAGLGTIGGLIYRREWKLKKEKRVLENEVRERTRQIEEQKEEILSQRDMVEKQNQQIVEMDQLKSRFFTNVSHEFRTPLALIQSPVEELLDDPHRSEKDRRKLNMVQRNAGRLLNLVNQLLDMSKLDGSGMKLELVKADAMKQLKALAGSFTSFAETKSIRYDLHFPEESLNTWFDAEKLEKIAINLLSNAFKFTPEGGEIIFSAWYKNNAGSQIIRDLIFSVTDTGTGIPETSLGKIFDRFYQVESSVKKKGGGTGIGLSLALDLARLMHGDITVVSEICKGSIFTVQIPLGKDHLNESEFMLLKKLPEQIAFEPENYEKMEDVKSGEVGKIKGENPLLLIVEDNRDILMQLRDNFNGKYIIFEAIDGVAGLKKATELIPDLIITDLMMPRMDGIELVHKLKNDERTSHIPIIMLTAKVTPEDRINGFHTGADDYIPKPFHMAELKARAANLIEMRRKLRERFSREITLEPSVISVTSLDEQFLNRAIQVVEKHLDDENFGMLEFRDEMNMTRSTLFRKLQALTGQPPTEFIRTIRLKRAASLLKQNFGNVTQVSLEVGFINLSHFNKSFKKLYGVSPMEYAKSNQAVT